MAQTGQQFYGYLFKSDKKPTKVLDALLRGIANYISESVAPLEEKTLTPAKLASFYKAVGGNYDSLFVDVPSPSISWIYASIGCQHTLQPTSDDFQPPSIPALTTRGFVRWQSIEILLGPEEHVPFIQTAVRNFAIRNPDTGEIFPVDLPTEAFPLVANKDIEKWHDSCAEKLRQRATPDEEHEGSRPDLPPRPKVRSGFAHVRPGGGERGDYFEPKYRSRPIPYQHVPAASPGGQQPTHSTRQFLSPDVPESPSATARGRRRSFPENVSSPSSPLAMNCPPAAVPPPHARRHSHPRQARRGSRSSDASSSSEGGGTDDPPSPANVNVKYVPSVAAAGIAGAAASTSARRRSHPNSNSNSTSRYSPPIIRFAPPPPPPTPSTPTPPPPEVRPRRRISRDRAAEKEEKRHSFTSTIPIDLTGKLSAPFLLGNRERERTGARRRNDSRGPTVKWKDLSGVQVNGSWRRGSKSSEEDRTPTTPATASRRSSRRESVADVDVGVGVGVGVDGDAGMARPLLRERRYSSHEDVTRRKREREGDRAREWEGARRRFREGESG